MKLGLACRDQEQTIQGSSSFPWPASEASQACLASSQKVALCSPWGPCPRRKAEGDEGSASVLGLVLEAPGANGLRKRLNSLVHEQLARCPALVRAADRRRLSAPSSPRSEELGSDVASLVTTGPWPSSVRRRASIAVSRS